MTNKQRTKEILKRSQKIKRQNNQKIVATVSTLSLCGVLFAGFITASLPTIPVGDSGNTEISANINTSGDTSAPDSTGSSGNIDPPDDTEKTVDPVDYSALIAAIKVMRQNSPEIGMGASGGVGAEGVESGSSSSSGRIENTDNQVKGVIEGDLLKRNKDYVFYLQYGGKHDYVSKANPVDSGYRREYSINSYSIQGKESKLISGYTILKMSGYPTYYFTQPQMYISEDGTTLTVICDILVDKMHQAAIYTIDVSDPANMQTTSTVYLSGFVYSSRMTDEGLLVFTNYYPKKYVDDKGFYAQSTDYVPFYRVGAEQTVLDMNNIQIAEDRNENYDNCYTTTTLLKDGKVLDSKSIYGYSGTVDCLYVSQNNVIMAKRNADRAWYSDNFTDEQNYTEFFNLSYGNGKLKEEKNFRVHGYMNNRYNADEKDGIFRVVNATGLSRDKYNASLYCVDLKDPDKRWAVENFSIDGETIRSVRFNGNSLSVCTSVQVSDPVFIFDLSDYEHITVKDTGTIGGYSTTLRQFNDYYVGIGLDEKSNFKLEFYQEEEDKVVSVTSYIEAKFRSLSDYKSYLFDEENGNIGIPVTSPFSLSVKSCYYYWFTFDGKSLSVQKIDLSVNEYINGMFNIRAYVEGDYLYIFTSIGKTVVNDTEHKDTVETKLTIVNR